jgi:hypothetical protein
MLNFIEPGAATAAQTMIASDPRRSDRRAAYPARRESAAKEKSEA